MPIRKIQEGKWRVDVTIGKKLDGSRDRRTRTFDLKAEAEKFERLLLARKDANLVSGRITLLDFINEYFWQQKQHLRPNTRRGYERDINLRILPAFGSWFIEDIKRANIQEMLFRCPTRKAATNARETLSTILKLACEMDLIVRNPAAYNYQYPLQHHHEHDHYGLWLTSFRQQQHFFALLNMRKHNPMVERMCVLGLCFGLRKGEILGLNWEHIDLNRRVLRVCQTYVSGQGGAYIMPPKTEKSFRIVPIPTFAYRKLSEWYKRDARALPTGPLIVTRKGTRMNPDSAQSMLRRFMRNNPDLPRITLHSMRHSFATSCVNAGIEVSKISAFLGHEQVSTTYDRYVKPLAADLQSEINAMDAAFHAEAEAYFSCAS